MAVDDDVKKAKEAEEICASMQNIINELKKQANESIQIVDTLKRQSDSFLQKARNEVAQNLIDNTFNEQEMVDRIQSFITKIDELGKDAEAKIEKGFGKILGDIEKIDKRSLADIISDDLKRDWNKVKEVATTLKTNVSNGIKSIVNACKDGLNFIKDKTVEFFKSVGNKTADATKFVGTKVADGAKATGKAISDIAQEIADGASFASSKVVEAASACKQKINEGRAGLSHKLEEHLRERLKNREEKTRELDEKVQEGRAD